MKAKLYSLVSHILNWFAARLLAKHQPKIVAVTGSVGKTSAKRAIAAAVEQDFKTQWHDGNFNSDVGLPLALFELTTPKNLFNPFAWLLIMIKMLAKLLAWSYPYELLVLELGIDKPGEMGRFITYIHPDIAVLTAIQGAHLSGLGDIETVYQEKTLLAQVAKKVVVNNDDELLRERFYPENKAKTTRYGFHPSSDIRIKAAGHIEAGQQFSLEGQQIHSQFTGKHSLLTLAAGWSVGKLLRVNFNTRRRALEELTPYPGRMNILDGLRGSTIIDDSYNAVTPQAVIAALDTLKEFKGQRKIAILGTMNEMGSQTEAGHRLVGEYAARVKLDLLVTIGQPAQDFLVDAAIKNSLASESIQSFTSPYDAGHHVAGLLKKGDIVLVKGSQNKVFSEEATALLLNLESDRSKLVRQSAYWQKIKHDQFG